MASQKRVSDYFREAKNVSRAVAPDNKREYYTSQVTDKSSSVELSTNKRTLRVLQQKYDNFCSQPVRIPSVLPIPVPRIISEKESKNVIKQKPKFVTQVPRNTNSNFCDERRDLRQWNRQLVTKSVTQNDHNNKEKEDTSISPKPEIVNLVGSVENVITWNKMLKNIQIYITFNIIGKYLRCSTLSSTSVQTIFFIKGSKTILECSYYGEALLPSYERGKLISCIGRVIGVQRFHVYKLQVLPDSEFQDYRRVVYLSQRKAFEIANREYPF